MERGNLDSDRDGGDDVQPGVVVVGRGQPSDARWDFAWMLLIVLVVPSILVYVLGWLAALVVYYKLFRIPQDRLMRGVEFFVVVIALLVLGGLIWLLIFGVSVILAWVGFLLT